MNIKVLIALALGFLVVGLAACSSATPTPSPVPTDTLVPTATFTLTPTPTSTSTPTPTPTVTPEPTPIGGGGQLMFVWNSYEYAAEGISYSDLIKLPRAIGYDRKDYSDIRGKMNLFTSDPDGANAVPLTTDGLDGYIFFRDISPDGNKLLVYSYPLTDSTNKFSSLYVIDLTGVEPEPRKITRFATGGIAKWVNNEQIVYKGLNGGVDGIYLTDLTGADPVLLSEGKEPMRIVSLRDGGVYWLTSYRPGDKDAGIWWSSLDGTVQCQVATMPDVYVAPDGNTLAWRIQDFEKENSVVFISTLENLNNHTSFTAPAFIEFEWPNWSPDSSKILLITDYFVEDKAAYLFDSNSGTFTTLPAPPARDDGFTEAISGGIWSPDSKRLIIKTTYVDEEGWKRSGTIRILDLTSNTFIDTVAATFPRGHQMVWQPGLSHIKSITAGNSQQTAPPCTNP